MKNKKKLYLKKKKKKLIIKLKLLNFTELTY